MNDLTAVAEDATMASMSNQPHTLTEADFFDAILQVLPMAELGEDMEGQVIVYTNCDYTGNGSEIAGPVTPLPPALQPATPGSVRLAVLDDGETYSGLTGSTIVEVPDDYDGEAIEEAFRRVNTDDEDPNLAYVAQFDADGVVN